MLASAEKLVLAMQRWRRPCTAAGIRRTEVESSHFLQAFGETARLTRGEIDIGSVLKGAFKEKMISVYTGSGLGDCGLLGEFVNSAIYYNLNEFGVLELGLAKAELAGNALYFSSICGYAKGPEDDEE